MPQSDPPVLCTQSLVHHWDTPQLQRRLSFSADDRTGTGSLRCTEGRGMVRVQSSVMHLCCWPLSQSNNLWSVCQVVNNPGNYLHLAHLCPLEFLSQKSRLNGVKYNENEKHDAHSAACFTQMTVGSLKQLCDGVFCATLTLAICYTCTLSVLASTDFKWGDVICCWIDLWVLCIVLIAMPLSEVGWIFNFSHFNMCQPKELRLHS